MFHEQYISYKVNKQGFKTPEVSSRTAKQNIGLSSLLQSNPKIFVGGVEHGYLKKNGPMFLNDEYFKGQNITIRRLDWAPNPGGYIVKETGHE